MYMICSASCKFACLEHCTGTVSVEKPKLHSLTVSLISMNYCSYLSQKSHFCPCFYYWQNFKYKAYKDSSVCCLYKRLVLVRISAVINSFSQLFKLSEQ